MTSRDKDSQAIMGAAMQFVKSGNRTALEAYPLALLKKADYQLSNRDINSGYRNAIKDLITELNENHAPLNQVEEIKNKIWSHPILTPIIILGVIVIGVGSFTDALDKILKFIETRVVIQNEVAVERGPITDNVTSQMSSENGKYYGVDELQYISKSNQIKVVHGFGFQDSKGIKWDLPSGYISDMASIPKSTWSILGSPFEGMWAKAAVLHDYYSTTMSRGWKDTNIMFYDALLSSGVGKQKSKLLYAAVYNFGPRWDSKTATDTRRRILPTTPEKILEVKNSVPSPATATVSLKSMQELKDFLLIIKNNNMSLKEIEIEIDTTGE